jgi:hypothetical protein
VHEFLRSDDDRARHDHPWLANASWLIAGGYREWITDELFVERHEGEFKLRWGLHRTASS